MLPAMTLDWMVGVAALTPDSTTCTPKPERMMLFLSITTLELLMYTPIELGSTGPLAWLPTSELMMVNPLSSVSTPGMLIRSWALTTALGVPVPAVKPGDRMIVCRALPGWNEASVLMGEVERPLTRNLKVTFSL